MNVRRVVHPPRLLGGAFLSAELSAAQAGDRLPAALSALILERFREHRRYEARADALGPLRRLLIAEAVGAAEFIARLRSTLDGTDASVRRLLVWLRHEPGSAELTAALSTSERVGSSPTSGEPHAADRPAST
jgi:hypothetical protein